MSYTASNIPTEKHCFFGRQGGVSGGIYCSLNVNLKSNDQQNHVLKNLDVIAAYYKLERSKLLLINQGITGHAEYTNEISQHKITADGIVTDKSGIILCIGTADCAPILFYDKEHHIIGAAHAGWRGALKNIAENTLDVMLKHGARKANIHAAIGPCLQQQSFEVGRDMLEEFINVNPDNAKWFTAGRDLQHFQFDMEGYLVEKLKKYGLTNITKSGIDTYTSEDSYFSFRRNTHQGLINSPKDFPTHLSTIML